MSPVIESVIAVGAVSLVSLIGIATISLKEHVLRRALFLLISLAAGALLGDAFIHLLPEAFSKAEPLLVSITVIAGVLSFFLLEKFLNWHHSHGEEEYSPHHAHIHPLGNLVITSDAVHNFVDGLVIGGAFMISTEVGVATTIAIALHEIPQEVADFGLLLHSGLSRAKALLVNFLSALTAFLGLAAAFLLGEMGDTFVPLIAAFAAGNFIYIALADLVPELQKTTDGKRSLMQFAVVLMGITAMVLLLGTEAEGHGHESLEYQYEAVPHE